MNSNYTIERYVGTFLDRLQDIFADMDAGYTLAADHYQFGCDGCTDNCCLTRFYHHTNLEYFYLRRGFEKLDRRRRHKLLSEAEKVCREAAEADKKQLPVRQMCPLNHDSVCVLYPYRPMICRLHGIPHELRNPGRQVVCGPGCSTFDERCSDKPYIRFDRTAFYIKLAGLENEFKQTAGLAGRIKMTVAEMIVSMARQSQGSEAGFGSR